MSYDKRDDQTNNEETFTFKALSVGIGLGELRHKPSSKTPPPPTGPKHGPLIPQSKLGIRPTQVIAPTKPQVPSQTVLHNQQVQQTQQVSESHESAAKVSTADLNAMRRFTMPPRRPQNKSQSWITEVFAHLVDLAVVMISACAVIMLFGLLGRNGKDGLLVTFSESLSFWLGRFSYLEIVLLLYAGLLVYWMIFRVVAGHTIGQSLKSESLSWNAVRSMMRNKQKSN